MHSAPMSGTAYHDTISWLFGLQRFGIKLGLQTVTRLLELLGNPHHALRCIHIAGTNGKGSTAAFLHAIYAQAGYRPGLYTSPHLVDFTERIVVGGTPIARSSVTALVRRLRTVCRRNDLEHITFFEFTTALALTYFAHRGADPVILETGLGGRLDATNVVDPLLSIITTVSREHTAQLGPTLLHITREKAGIIKPGRACISAVTRPDPREYIRRVCRNSRAGLLEYGRDFLIRSRAGGLCYQGLGECLTGLRPGLAGRHQARNAALAITAAAYLRSHGIPCTNADVSEGLRCCSWPGRLETIVFRGRRFVLDGAHNPAAWQALAWALKKNFTFQRLIMIAGVMRDKDIRSLVRCTEPAHLRIYVKPQMDRAADRVHFEKYVVFSQKKRVLWCASITRAMATAIAETGPGDLICITGSLFTVGEARERMCGRSPGPGGRIGL